MGISEEEDCVVAGKKCNDKWTDRDGRMNCGSVVGIYCGNNQIIPGKEKSVKIMGSDVCPTCGCVEESAPKCAPEGWKDTLNQDCRYYGDARQCDNPKLKEWQKMVSTEVSVDNVAVLTVLKWMATGALGANTATAKMESNNGFDLATILQRKTEASYA